MLCSEEDPSHCHRRLLVGRVLRQRKIEVQHIRGDGTVQAEDELEITGGARLTVSTNVLLPVPLALVAEIVILLVPIAVGVPLITPVEVLILKPAGKPVAL